MRRAHARFGAPAMFVRGQASGRHDWRRLPLLTLALLLFAIPDSPLLPAIIAALAVCVLRLAGEIAVTVSARVLLPDGARRWQAATVLRAVGGALGVVALLPLLAIGGSEKLARGAGLRAAVVVPSIAPMLAANSTQNFAVKADGTLWSWGGDGGFGELGHGTTAGYVRNPRQVTLPRAVKAVSTGEQHTLAVLDDGSVWSWGANYGGKLGNGTTTHRATPAQVSGLNGVEIIAVSASGTVYSWGSNVQKAMGHNCDGCDILTPTAVAGLSNIVAIAAGYHHSMALESNGSVWAWGFDDGIGQLGHVITLTPLQVHNLSNVVQIAVGLDYSVALKSDGSVWTWGADDKGQLGRAYDPACNGMSPPNDCGIPRQVTELSGIAKVGASRHAAFAAGSDGALWSWGEGFWGALGNGARQDRDRPVRVLGVGGQGNFGGATLVASGASARHALAARDDGSVVYWGSTYTRSAVGPGGIQCTPDDPNTPPTTTLIYCNLTPFVVEGLTLLPTPYDALHNCALSTSWSAHAGAGVCPTFGTLGQQQTDLLVPTRGVALELTRTYNSADPTESGFGVGWSFLYGMRVMPDPGDALMVRRADGRRDRYTAAGGGAYTPPPGNYDTLVRAGDGTTTLTTTDQIVYRFNTAGQLTSIADRNNNRTTLVWSTTGLYNGTGGLVVTEPAQRQFVLSYGAGVHGQRFVRLREQGSSLGRIMGYGYNAAGELVTVTDPRSNTIAMTYDAQHRLLTVVDQEQRAVLTTTYDGQGRVKTQQPLGGATWTFDYPQPTRTTVDGPRTDVADTITYVHDAGYRSVQIIDPLSGTTTIERDSANRPYRVTDRHNGVTLREFDASGNVTKLTDAAGKITAAEYNARNNPTWIRDGNTHQTNFDYTTAGNLWHVYRPLGKTTTYAYAPSGNGDLISETDQDGFATTYGYDDPHGNVNRVTDPSGRQMTYQYDAGGRLAAQIDPYYFEISYGYAAVTAPNEELTIRYYSMSGTITGEVTTYDKAGWAITTKNANLRVTRYTYDPAGRVGGVTVAEGTGEQAVTRYTYDPAGNLKSRLDNMVNPTAPPGRLTEYTHDPLGRPLTVTGPDAGGGQGRAVTSYLYTDAERKVTQSGPIAGRSIVTVADPLGRPATVSYPQGDYSSQAFTLTYEYDGVGNRTKVAHSLLGNTTYIYDALDRLTAVTSPRISTGVGSAAPVTVGYQYDQLYDQPNDPLQGKPICTRLLYPPSDRDQVARSLLSCPDKAGRLNWVRDWNGKQTAYHYDPAGRLDRLEYPNYTKTTYRYDDFNRLTEVMNERLAGATMRAAIATVGGTPPLVRPQGAATPAIGGTPARPTRPTTPAVDGVGAVELPPLTNVAVDLGDPAMPLSAFAAGPITDHIYNLDNMGNRTIATELTAQPGGLTPTSTTYEYDAQERLKKVVYPGTTPETVEYSYHPNGDRRFVTRNGQQQPELVYDGAGRLKATAENTYDYDRAGNQRQRVTSLGGVAEEFAYDGAGRLVRHQASAKVSTNWYDGDGLRLLSYTGPAVNGTNTVWDRNRSLPTVLVEYGPSETTFAVTGLALIARVVANGQDEQYLFYHHDGLGSTRAITTAGGATVQAYNYDAFGTARDPWTAPGATLSNAYRFTGEPYDGGTNSYYLRARHYDPATGRFTQPDPIGYGGGGNLYAYAANNPATLTDPTGLCPVCLAGAAIGSGVGAAVGFGGYALFHDGPWDWGNAGKVTAAAAVGGAIVGATLGLGLEAAGIVGGTEASAASVKIANAAGSSSNQMQTVRTIQRGEKLADIFSEMRLLTYQSGNEYALVRLTSGERALVTGGRRGIDLGQGVTRLYAHTHPYGLRSPLAAILNAASPQDRQALRSLGQTFSYILEGGETIKFRP